MTYNKKVWKAGDIISSGGLNNMENGIADAHTTLDSLSIPTKTTDLINDSGFITNTVNNLTNYTPTSGFSAVAFTGSYDDLTDKPTIPVVPDNITTQGNTFNGANQLVQLDASGKLPAIDGSQLTGISSGESYELPIASTTVLGGIKIGTGLSIDSSGVVSVTSGPEGTTDYTQLTNKPQINSIELTGNKSLSDLGIQAAGNYLVESDLADYVTDTELEAKGYLTSATLTSDTNFEALQNQADTTDTIVTNLQGTVQMLQQDVNDLASDTLTIVAGDNITITDKLASTLERTGVVSGDISDATFHSYWQTVPSGQTNLTFEAIIKFDYSSSSQPGRVEIAYNNGANILFAIYCSGTSGNYIESDLLTDNIILTGIEATKKYKVKVIFNNSNSTCSAQVTSIDTGTVTNSTGSMSGSLSLDGSVMGFTAYNLMAVDGDSINLATSLGETETEISADVDVSTIESEIDELQSQVGSLKFVTLTQTEYDSLQTKDTNTLYFITEETT